MPRSDLMSVGRPRLLTKRVRHAMNDSADKLDTTSMCTAFDAEHTNIHKYAFTDLAFLSKLAFTKYGPAKSVDTLENGRAAVTRSAGRSDMNGG